MALGMGWPGGPLNIFSFLCKYGLADPYLSWLVTGSLEQTQEPGSASAKQLHLLQLEHHNLAKNMDTDETRTFRVNTRVR